MTPALGGAEVTRGESTRSPRQACSASGLQGERTALDEKDPAAGRAGGKDNREDATQFEGEKTVLAYQVCDRVRRTDQRAASSPLQTMSR